MRHRRGPLPLLIALAVAGALLPATAGASGGARTGPAGPDARAFQGSAAAAPQLLFARASGSDGLTSELHAVELDGTGSRQLTGDHFDSDGRWSPDGTQVAFIRRDAAAATDVAYVADAADGDPEPVAPSVTDVAELAWSPEGDQLALARVAREGQPSTDDGIWVVGADGDGLVRLTDADGVHGGHRLPTWSPAGDTIAYVSGLEDGDVHVVGAGGEDLRQLTHTVSVHASLAWSPDGRRLAFTGFPKGRDRDEAAVYTMGRDGSGLQAYTDPATHGAACRVTWAPTGRQLAFDASANSCEGSLHVCRLDLHNGAVTRLNGDHPHALWPQWTPDAREVVFTVRSSPTAVDSSRVIAVDDRLAERPVVEQAASLDVSSGPLVRVAGTDRIDTAVKLSRRGYEEADAVVIARADVHADALAGAPLAASLSAPLLLSDRRALPAATVAEVARLGATQAYLLGGEGALTPQVVDDLEAAGVTDVERVFGADRYATAAAVAQRLDDPTSAYVARGDGGANADGWADAVGVSGLAAHEQRPLLLVAPGRLPDATADALDELGVTDAVIVGGTGAVSAAVEDAVAAGGVAVDRLAGGDRFGTSLAVARASVQAGLDPASTWVATGTNWPDALAAGPAAARAGAVLLLVHGSSPAAIPATGEWFAEHGATLSELLVVGGAAAVTSPAAVTLLRMAQ